MVRHNTLAANADLVSLTEVLCLLLGMLCAKYYLGLFLLFRESLAVLLRINCL
jgi:hypothetical protein